MKDDHIDLLYAGGLALCALVGYLAFVAFRALKPAVIVLAALSFMAESEAAGARDPQGLNIVQVWLLISADHSVAVVVATFGTEADCEHARATAVARVRSGFLAGRTACVPAKVVQTWKD